MVKCFLSALYCVGFACIPFCLLGQKEGCLEKEDSMVVDSGEAQYDGKEIILTGQVSVQHSLGQISACRLCVQPCVEKEKGKGKFGYLKISQDVQLKLPGGGELYCQLAEIDYAKMQGVFLGNAESPDVVYLNNGEKKENSFDSRPFLEVKSSQMILELAREPITSKILVKQIAADQNIRVSYHRDYLLHADHAIYQRLPTDLNSSSTGLLTLSMEADHVFCQMTSLFGDHLVAKSIKVNTIDRQLWLENPSGSLLIRRECNPSQNLELRANELLWDDRQQTLTLKGNVDLIQNKIVQIQTDGELSIGRKISDGKQDLRFIQSPQNTRISYVDAIKSNTHQLYCPGNLLIDHEHQKISLQGLLSLSWDEVDESKQVYVEDVLGEMYADRVEMEYTWQDQEFVPEKILLLGHVRLLNRFDGHLEESGSILHYGLADSVEYHPKNQEMILLGTKGHRVLFYDKVNNVKMSAPSLKIKHDMKLHKDSIQGIGDVRFTFIEKELEQIKQRFRFLEASQGQELDYGTSKK